MGKLYILVVLAFVITLTGCNTWNGFGRDLEKVGDKIQNSAKN
jgi:predicted small secreted protein